MSVHTDQFDSISHNSEKEQLKASVIEAQSSITILAGSETTAIALTAAVYSILSDYKLYEKLCYKIWSASASSAAGNL